jgi:hypothetical protein
MAKAIEEAKVLIIVQNWGIEETEMTRLHRWTLLKPCSMTVMRAKPCSLMRPTTA